MGRVTFRLHRAQADFTHCDAFFRGFVGGIGCGKSFICAYDLLRKAKSGRTYMYVAPTYKVLQRADLRTFLDLARQMRYLRAFNKTSNEAWLGNGAHIFLCSGEDPESLRGPNVTGVVLSEASLMKSDVYDICIGRLREGGEQGWLSAGFTPKGRDHWTFCTFSAENPDVRLFYARTKDNVFLPPGFEERLRRQYTTAFAAQELDGQFVDLAGTVAKREWFKPLDSPPKCTHIVRAWDFAATPENSETDADYTVGCKLGKFADGWVVLDINRSRTAAGSIASLVKSVAAQDGRAVGIYAEQEGGSAGKIAYSYLSKELAGYAIHPVVPSGDKLTRAMPFLAQAEAGNIYFLRAPWNAQWLGELAGFPSAAHDDQVDATVHAFNALSRQFVGFSMS